MAKFDTIQKRKVDFLAAREGVLRRKVSAAEKKLLDLIIEKFIDELEVSNGIIVSNGKNIKLTQGLDKIFEEFNRIVQDGLINGYIKDISEVKLLNKSYFGEFETNKRILDIVSNKSSLQINRRLGISPKGVVLNGGFLNNFIKDNRLKNEFAELVTKGITGGTSFRELKADIKTFIIGNEDRLGGLQAQYRTFIYDTYQQIDRLESGIYAEELGMQSFIYSGGKIATTRNFCCQRNGKIWTVDEAKKWENLEFQGKNKDYNPLVDLGGHNCRHTTQYISNLISARRRDDLKLDDEGNLIVDKKGKKQKLNKC